MTKTIWKFPLEIAGEQSVQMPAGAKILDVQMQDGKLMLWALVDPNAPKEPREILIHGTGHPVENVGGHIGTFQMYGGTLVFHAFEAE